MNLVDQIKDAIDANVPASDPGLRLSGETLRRARRRRRVVASTATVSLLVAALIGYAASASIFLDRVVTDRVQPAAVASPHRVEPLTPEARAASGSRYGKSWSLHAYRGAGTGADAGEGALCLRWQWEQDPSGDACIFGWQEPVPSSQSISGTADWTHGEFSIFYGRVGRHVSAVELSTAEGESFPAKIYESPKELGVSFDFFVGFAPAQVDVTTNALRDGVVVGDQFFDALPRITVQIEGSGDGRVSGHLVCEGCPSDLAEQVIDCSQSCWAEAEKGTRLELTATSEDGSRFIGWGGACAGSDQTCVIDVGSNASATVEFSR